MIDFHAHVLPDMDDGSRSIQESIQMLRISADMGVDTIVATPHFYIEQMNIADFLYRRKCAYEDLVKAGVMEVGMPDTVLGAEVHFFPGMGSESGIVSLCITGTSCMLLEMPFEPWTKRTLNEVRNLSAGCGITPIIAHIERYFAIQTKYNIGALLDMEVLVQINGSFLIDTLTQRKALKLLKQNCVHLLGSDCHDITRRKPNLEKAFAVIYHSLGKGKLDQIEALGRFILMTGGK